MKLFETLKNMASWTISSMRTIPVPAYCCSPSAKHGPGHVRDAQYVFVKQINEWMSYHYSNSIGTISPILLRALRFKDHRTSMWLRWRIQTYPIQNWCLYCITSQCLLLYNLSIENLKGRKRVREDAEQKVRFS